MLKALVLHNYYQQPGGEDLVFRAEVELLRLQGHHVETHCVTNETIRKMNPLALAASTLWSRSAYRCIKRLIGAAKPDVVHFHNTFPLLSPSVYYGASELGVPIVQTIHNYRIVCPNALLHRDNHVCEDCLGKRFAWPGVFHACYRNSPQATLVTAGMSALHAARDTWRKKVDTYITPSEFTKQKHVEAGLPESRIRVKPHFVYPDPGPGSGDGDYALFVGRLTQEKGIATLLRAWSTVGERLRLKIVGDGPLASSLNQELNSTPGVEWLGQRTVQEVYAMMGKAKVVITPSESYETFGRVVIEAYAVGTPVVASKIGALAELVQHGRTGLLFEPGSVGALSEQVEFILAHPSLLRIMRNEARQEYLLKYTAEQNYRMLMEIYREAVSRN